MAPVAMTTIRERRMHPTTRWILWLGAAFVLLSLGLSLFALHETQVTRTQLNVVRAVAPGMTRSAVIERLGEPRSESTVSDGPVELPDPRVRTILSHSTANRGIAQEDLYVLLDEQQRVVAVLHR
jgi:hypothetical protein